MQKEFKTLKLTSRSGQDYREKRNALILEAAYQGHTLEQIGEWCGVTRQQISLILKEMGVPKSELRQEKRLEDAAVVKDLAAQGKNLTQIAEEIGWKINRLHAFKTMMGIDIPKYYVRHPHPVQDAELRDLIDLFKTGEYKVSELAAMTGRNPMALSMTLRRKLGIKSVNQYRKQLKGTA